MSTNTMSSLSMKRIIISLTIIAMIPLTAYAADLFASQIYISQMFAMNIWGSVLIIYNWNLFAIHYNRMKNNLKDGIIYTLIGVILIFLLLWIDLNFLQASIPLPNSNNLRLFGYARPGMYIAFSFMESSIVNIGFKALTDHLDVRRKEIQAILISGLLFGFVLTALFTPFDLSLWFRTYLYNMVLVGILSYLYNQSNSFMPGLLSMGTVYLLTMVISMLQ